ncbi:hypothetical protein HCN44_003134 [Aphidius gifuensis]|uniref:Receptor-type tyrosine-protein phosphatase N2 n=1 Tax=Aphidius gifuensis TaxID=684658 RepID=A0A834XID5_APHGI|nr:hypothetical protein HCN44_003134 [Aphidius gifuensis]
MGRKRWWMGGSFLALFLVLVLLHVPTIQGEGEVGCLFDPNVCKSTDETCWDDAAFGKCIRLFNAIDDDTYHEIINWLHPYTQCVMQNALNSIKFQLKHDEKFCLDFKNTVNSETADFIDIENDDDDDDDTNEEISPLAVVKFSPSRGHGYGDFANEMYYPPETNDDSKNEEIFLPYIDENKKPTRHPTLNFNKNDKDNLLNDKHGYYYDDNDDDDKLIIDDKYDDELIDLTKKYQRITDDMKNLNIKKKKNDNTMFRLRREPRIENTEISIGDDLSRYIDLHNLQKEKSKNSNDNWKFGKTNNSYGEKTLFDLVKENKLRKGKGKFELLWNDDDEDEEDDNDNGRGGGDNGGYYPGYHGEGMEGDRFDSSEDLSTDTDDPGWDGLQEFFNSQGISGFKRPERLDVKKPGPLFPQNNYAFNIPTEISGDDDGDKKHDRLVKKEMIAGRDITLLSPSETYRNRVDMDYVYLQFDKPIHNWKDGEDIVKQVGKIIGFDLWDLSDVRVGNAEVTFKVNENSLNMNATDVVTHLYKLRNELEKTIHVNPIRAGIGDKIKLPAMWEIMPSNDPINQNLLGILVAAGSAAVATAAVIILFLARKYARIRAKLASLSTPDPEASKDYQELCRARMQAKQPTEKIESPRIVSLSRESESSNRSSTSSWGGEEAAALANMDISTGRIVLSYMEDHLKNKDRLDQEWAAVCAYESEPSSISIATDKTNAERNRPGSAPTYDHSRVVLNDLSNENNSDYINASTITDHDPRNPAYIATQGPLPQTSADFWQLVWEQGSVVIVMLTRLTEEGKAMCHRYWPEEGSELYHIYEVHLVSEHIWCDDYLVRSFYLKNLRTGETRTVTQFHFLSWPDNGIPSSTKALLEFRRKVNKSYRGRSCPIVVHCSDGAGRTGTYCLIDMVLNRMIKGAKEIDIAAALEHIRDQRPDMVSTKKQFEFVLVAVAEEVHAILKALPTQINDKNPPLSQTSISSNSDK